MTKVPLLTEDLFQTRTDLNDHGYCLIASVLSSQEVEAARERLGVLATFCAPQFTQQENQSLGLDRDH